MSAKGCRRGSGAGGAKAAPLYKLAPVPLARVKITGGFWKQRVEINRTVTLPIAYGQLKKTGAIDAWKLDWRAGRPNKPGCIWDSDAAKWIEAAAYTLAVHPDGNLEKRADRIIGLIAKAQQADGYLNVYFSVVEPGKRWTNLRDKHELYCAGHLIEAAVAYHTATGKRKLLDTVCRYADHIGGVFGRKRGQKRGYPGHAEIELALIKLYHATGAKSYLRLAAFFIDERGRRPCYFDREAKARGEVPARQCYDYAHIQAHRPVREQTTAEGHAVRVGYLCAGMADVGNETGDKTLIAACRRIWRNIVERRLYVHGGAGSSSRNENFTFDYDLPNETAYAETCAAIGLVFFAQRMLRADPDGRYADVMERALYNGVISGVALDGRKFFYDNLLAVTPELYRFSGQKPPFRQTWFPCPCCPPNLARLLASLGGYVYSQGKRAVLVHLYISSRADLEIDGQTVT